MKAGLEIRRTTMIAAATLAAATMLNPLEAAALDADAARALARQSNCFKCHAIDKKKDGPAWKEVAARSSRASPTPRRSSPSTSPPARR